MLALLVQGRPLFHDEVAIATKLEEAPPDPTKRREVVSDLTREAEMGDPFARSRLALLRQDYAEAIAALDGGGTMTVRSSDLAVDRGAIRLLQFRTTGRMLDAAAALEELSDLTRGPAAQFNRVQALCALGLVRSAKSEADRFLAAKDRESGQALRLLAMRGCVSTSQVRDDFGLGFRGLDSSDTQARRKRLEEHWIPVVLATRERVPELLAEAEQIQRLTRDRLVLDLAAELNGLIEEGDDRGLDGVRSWVAAERLASEFRPEDARAALERADALIPAEYRAWRARLQLSMSANSFHLQRYEISIDLAEKILAVARDREWLDLEGRLLWLEGMCFLQTGEPARALASFRNATAAFEAAVEPGLSATLKVLESDALGSLGRFHEALQVRVSALRDIRASGLKSRELTALEDATFLLLQSAYPSTALAFIDEALAASGNGAEDLVRAEQFWKRASVLVALGREEEALAAIDAAALHAEKIASDAFGARTRMGIAATRAAARSSIEPKSALAEISAAISESGKTGYQWFLPDLYIARARAARRLRLVDQAGADLERAFVVAQHWSENLSLSTERALFFDTQRRLAEEAVVLFSEDNANPAMALEWAFRPRGSSWSGALAADRGLSCIGALEPRLAVFLLPRGIVRWHCDDGALRMDTVTVDRRIIVREIGSFRRRILEGATSDALRPQAERLFSWLFEPISESLRAGQATRVLLDGLLSGVPTSALRDGKTGRLVAELADVTETDAWARPLRRGRPLEGASEPILVVANPNLSTTYVVSYPDLPGALKEGEAIARRFPRSELLSGARANLTALLSRLREFSSIHIAAHGVARPSDPGKASILLADGPDVDELSADSIALLELNHLKLVVLSICESGAGYESSSVGAMSLARAFLDGGAAIVVGTRWPVEDSASRRLMDTFYQLIADGRSVPSALRAAQSAFMNSSDPMDRMPVRWAGYFAIEGSEAPTRERR